MVQELKKYDIMTENSRRKEQITEISEGNKMTQSVLLINISSEERKEKLSEIIRKEKLEVKLIRKEDYGQTIGALAGIEEFYDKKAVYKGGELDGEMMVFAGISDDALDNILAAMRKEGIRINCKSVMTPYNIAWKIPDLYTELAKEHEEMTKRFGK